MSDSQIATSLSRAIDAAAWALRTSHQVGGPDPATHLRELRLRLLRRRHDAWRPGRREQVDLAVQIVASQLDGSSAVLPLSDGPTCRRLLLDLVDIERAVRVSMPSLAA